MAVYECASGHQFCEQCQKLDVSALVHRCPYCDEPTEKIGVIGPEGSYDTESDDELSIDSEWASEPLPSFSPESDPPLEPATLPYVVLETGMFAVIAVSAGGVMWAFIEYVYPAASVPFVPPLLGSLTTIGVLCVTCLLSQSRHTKPTASISLARWGICAIVALTACIGHFSCSSAIHPAIPPDAQTPVQNP